MVAAVARGAEQELLKAAKQPGEEYVVLQPETDLSTFLTILWRLGSCSTKMDKHFGPRTNSFAPYMLLTDSIRYRQHSHSTSSKKWLEYTSPITNIWRQA